MCKKYYRDFQLESAIKTIKDDVCDRACRGYEIDGYCNGCAYRIALDVLADEVQRERRRK